MVRLPLRFTTISASLPLQEEAGVTVLPARSRVSSRATLTVVDKVILSLSLISLMFVSLIAALREASFAT